MSRWLIVIVLAACGAKTAPSGSSGSVPPPQNQPIDHQSPEDQWCGTRGAAACPANFFCSYDDSAACGAADKPGRCKVKPEACAEIYQPVCACDGKQYGNECAANAAGQSVKTKGECPK